MSAVAPLLLPPPPPLAAWAAFRKFTVAEYHTMIETGVLTDEDRVELIEGYVVLKMPGNPPHESSVARVNRWFSRHVPDAWFVRCQNALTTQESELEPDLAVVRGGIGAFDARNPGPDDLALVIEVSDTSLARDRTDKLRVYARDRIPVYWIVNVTDRQVEVYTDPTGPDSSPVYRRREDFTPGMSVPVVLDGTPVGSVAVTDLLA